MSDQRKLYNLSCVEWNPRHVRFQVYDPTKALCGTLVVLTEDVFNFVKWSWNGAIQWNGKVPTDLERRTGLLPR